MTYALHPRQYETGLSRDLRHPAAYLGEWGTLTNIRYSPTRRGSDRWYATIKFWGLEPALELWPEDIAFLNWAYGLAIGPGFCDVVDIEAMAGRWDTKRHRLVNVACVMRDFDIVYPHMMDAEPPDPRHPVQALSQMAHAIRTAPYPVRRHIANVYEPHAWDQWTNAPLGLRIEVRPHADVDAILNTVAEYAQPGLHVEVFGCTS